MKNGILSICFMLSGIFLYAQGLENVIVEKYYVSDANDTTLNLTGGRLPVGSVTYRIFLDMLPGYKFQAVFGIPGAPGFPDHFLTFSTTTSFFNNEDRGSTTPTTFTKQQARNNTVMLDSWLSAGGSCSDAFGVLKSADTTLGGATVVNSDGILQNADILAGIPLTVQDGLYKMASLNPQAPQLLGFTPTELAVIDNASQAGNLIHTNNASWSVLGGTYAYPDSITNKILVAQFTTDGVFSFEMNVQLGTPVPGVFEQYVASSPIGNEILFAGLTYNSLVSTRDYPNASAHSFSVYPNPSNDIITLEIPDSKEGNDCSYTVYDSMGKKVIYKNLGRIKDKSREKIDLSSLDRGLYIVELLTGGVSSSKKIILN